ncbi:SDR family NAD(P)-dependent oxidoreductase [Geodermatophilus sp. DSM 44513]|uniref:SDR family NAD(P)-dependent oxidoreductase n=1 Tax=Geodermatophilus sp. DSM 44513 TaxID=1528104 RepID=UPI001270F9F8|nr:SDR family NAD(P)-dependent oxidoreductase [Geodermatophilus sp. DSM 44513]WNV75899.1 SDR family NAD(P)-dependent oxidoreductase [Geodermatophilus sp. DSM 44513]
MATVAVTGSTDGIGLAAARTLLAGGHRVLVHARSEERGRPVVDALDGDVVLVTGDLAALDEVRALADRLRTHAPLDALVHNAGVWVRGAVPRRSRDGLETTFAVNVLAAHLLTALLAEAVTGRLLWLGSGMARSGRLDPARLGAEEDPKKAYAQSKAADVALAAGWGRRLPHLASAAVDPGWVPTKLASAGAPGQVQRAGDDLAWCATAANLRAAPYWRARRPTAVPAPLRDPGLQDALLAGCDRLAGLRPGDRR